jgi:hypothetical protein
MAVALVSWPVSPLQLGEFGIHVNGRISESFAQLFSLEWPPKLFFMIKPY